MTEVFLGLGSNMGEREQFLSGAIDLLADEAGLVTQCSSIWETEPWGFEADTSFLNMVVSMNTSLSPEEILGVIHSVEERLGRRRNGKGYQSRTIDIDVLYWGDEIINRNGIIIPHKAIAERRFVLDPLCEIAPDFLHPVTHLTSKQMLSGCGDKSGIKLFGKL
jgi:2-amino-4-hydroxy-6-hydroxymethyldihydropteridine diphosphokinase